MKKDSYLPKYLRETLKPYIEAARCKTLDRAFREQIRSQRWKQRVKRQ